MNGMTIRRQFRKVYHKGVKQLEKKKKKNCKLVAILHDYHKKVKIDNRNSLASKGDRSLACVSTCLNHKVLQICILPVSVY